MARWWGEHRLAVGAVARWGLGPLDLYVRRGPREWLVGVTRENDPLIPRGELTDAQAIPAHAEVTRFVASQADGPLLVQPRLADRPVVSRPEAPLRVLGGEEVALFVTTPIWVALSRASRPLTEVATWRSSDTWFGPDTTRGELCYSARTTARLDLSEITLRPARAITTVIVRNQHTEPLHIERIKVPVPHLALYEGEDDVLWTPSLTMTRPAGDDPSVDLSVASGSPAQAGKARRVTEPRVTGKPSVVLRALDALWNPGGSA